eukprot:TRINITY_DN2933_c0_g1_i1.p1 TRINITY_DN2933_c0_g1~~TRINITY_DN2933_c0_g1_i1.p1  ORF type:complete len:1649 (-),score=541.75 TRINITY_DN2933_c0_g1_i1:463-5409(-)
MAKILNKEPAVYKQEQDNFLRELRKFHDQKGTGFKHIPCINGKEIDLYLLYWLVTAQGGWERVNNRNGWDELLESFDLQPSTVNGSLSLKQTYLRYLDSYEKYYFLGEEEEDEANLYFDEEDSRARRQRAQKIVQNVPTTYNDNQHKIAENLRAHYGLSTDIYRKTDYDRLGLSLLSPLPNEQDFAINVCTLLSNEGRHTLKLGKCPRLLDLLLAHAGVFNHHNLRDYISNSYQTIRNYDQVKFWRDVCKEKTVLELIYDERNFYPKPSVDGEGSSFKLSSFIRNDSQSEDSEEPKTGKQRIEALKARAEAELDDQDDELFSGGRGNGTKELTGQRVLQVATVIRNLSFEEDNSPVLAKNLTCLRFVLLCVNSSWANLNQMGFDILSNIASCVQLEEPSEDAVTDLLFQTLSRCIGAQDRFQVISSLDVLNKLCGQQANEDFIQRLLDQSVYGQLTEYLSLHDIHLLITVLECLYSLTSLGEIPCTALVKTHSAVELLVSLVTVEAQSYGPKACILMRVVETVPGTTAAGAQPAAPPTTGAPLPVISATGVPLRTPMLPTQPLPQPQVSNILPRHPMPLTRPPMPIAAGTAPGMAAPPRPAGPPGSQQVQLRVSNDEPHRVFCLSWLKATYEPCPGKSIEQNIMYKQYLASMHRMGRKEVISAQHYALCIRTLFGGSTGPNKKAVGDKVENHYTGIQVRAQPLPLKLTPAQAAAAQEASRQQSVAQQPTQNGVPQQQVVHQGQIVQVNNQGQIVQQGGQAGQVVQQKIVAQPGQQLVHVNAQGQLVNAQGQVIQGGVVQQVAQPQPAQAAKQVIQVNAQGQQIIVNSQGQQVLVNSQGQQMIQVNAQGQQVVQVNSQGQQVVQVNPQGQIVNQGGQVVVNQAGQVVQQRIVNSQGQIVAQGVVQGGQVIQQGMQTRIQPQAAQVIQQPPATQQVPVGQVIQRIIHPGGRVEERIVQASSVPGQPGQITIHGAGGQQQIIQTSGASQVIQPSQGGQVLQVSQPTSQPSHVILQPSGGAQQQTVVRTATPQTQVATSSADSSTQLELKQPKSAILQDLLKSKGVESSDLKQPEKVLVRHATPVSDEIVENGLSPLDGILPKDPKFGMLDGDGFSDLLERKSENMVNGILNHQDYNRMNGDIGNGKRSAGDHIDTSPAKRQALDSNTVVTNGGTTHGNGSVNGGALRGGVVVSSVGHGQVMVGGQGGMVLVSQASGQVGTTSSSSGVLPAGGQLVQSSSGQLFLKTTNSSGGLVLQPAQQQQVQQQVMVPGQQQGQAMLVQGTGGQKQLLFIQPGAGDNMGKHVVGQQIVRQVMVGQPAPAVIQSQAGGVATQQAVMRVSAPLASIGPAVPTTQQALPDSVHQMDGAADTDQDSDTEQDTQPLPQLDGMTGGAGEPPQQPVVPQPTVQHQPVVPAPAQQSVIQRPAQPTTTLTNGRTTPLAGAASPTPSPSPPPQVKIDTQKPFLCEWSTCMKAFKTPKEVENHAIAAHCPVGSDDIPCMWARCDGMKRKRFSLMTHLQDRHCHPQLMKLMAVRRVQIAQSGKSDVPLPPAPPPHPGYAPNAALHAIKRHAVEFVSPKELAMRDEKEGPVTKSIRLTASLILRNLVIYSSLGRSRLRAYESHLSTVALSNVESSRTVSQILYDMANSSDFA